MKNALMAKKLIPSGITVDGTTSGEHGRRQRAGRSNERVAAGCVLFLWTTDPLL